MPHPLDTAATTARSVTWTGMLRTSSTLARAAAHDPLLSHRSSEVGQTREMRLRQERVEELAALEWDELASGIEIEDGRAGAPDRLVVTGVGAKFGPRLVVRDVSLRVAPGEVVVLLGHNGCGKSSTLRAIYGLSSPSAGSVVVDDVDVTAASSRAHRELGVAFVPATDEVFADLSVRDNLLLASGERNAS